MGTQINENLSKIQDLKNYLHYSKYICSIQNIYKLLLYNIKIVVILILFTQFIESGQ